MGNLLTTLDYVIFFGSLLVVMIVGLWAGRKEDTSTDYYLAGKRTRWWGVAGSIFGSNVSANHMVGMMGVGFMYGFAQSHFEITAICGLLLLCYVFLPMYRRLNLFTLSEYLAQRYNEPTRIAYAIIMVAIMVVIQMVPGFYIGSRSVNLLLQGDTGQKAIAESKVDESGQVVSLKLTEGGYGYVAAPAVLIDLPREVRDEDSPQRARATAVIAAGKVVAISLTGRGAGYDANKPPKVRFQGGSSVDVTISPGDVDPTNYVIGIIIMAVVTGTYTIVGGLRAVIITDVIQSVLLLVAGLLVAFITFRTPEVGGWAGMVAQDRALALADQKLHLYNPSNHPGLPWTGVLTGLMVLHIYYWGTNQFIVQRALSAISDREARLGIITAGFFKLLIPFFSIGTGMAAAFYFQKQKLDIAQDVVFINLLTQLVVPIGYGLVGLVAAGMIGAILSSLDSMMNSAATIFTFDIYQRFINPGASEKRLIWVGRICIVIFIALAAYLTIVMMGANSETSFFLRIADHQGKLVAGVVVAFVLGMLWKRASGLGAFLSIVTGVALSYAIQPLYRLFVDSFKVTEDGVETYTGFGKTLVDLFGADLNFFHAVFLAVIGCALVHVGVSLQTPVDEEKGKLTWLGLGVFQLAAFRRAILVMGLSLVLFAVLAVLMIPWGTTITTATDSAAATAPRGLISPTTAAWSAAIWTFAMFFIAAVRSRAKHQREQDEPLGSLLAEDQLWAGLLASLAIFMMYYFY